LLASIDQTVFSIPHEHRINQPMAPGSGGEARPVIGWFGLVRHSNATSRKILYKQSKFFVHRIEQRQLMAE
jgi:hypothetical protein